MSEFEILHQLASALAVGLMMTTIAACYYRIKEQDDVGITSVIAILLTFT
ncbi:MAG: hypothetical protein OQK73_00875 [Gammaproteobacteria bacterium]|nr:hypothetical protein [Gammaproteobacteria bacterium]